MINETSKRVIYFRPHDANVVGAGSFYLDQIVWLNGDQVVLGESVGFNFGCYVNGYGGLTIGDRTLIGPLTTIHTANHAFDDPDVPLLEQGSIKQPVTIGEDCWLAMSVCVLPGVTIGDRSVIGAGSVVTRDIPADSVAVGNPCRVIRSRRATA
ncbi:MAG TPA: DapH/DapD/GlmU-related protein [Gaiellaceae bacterium]|nr:DapH/DapD/GlmU-related protein [Gaiellaceae bacterium]